MRSPLDSGFFLVLLVLSAIAVNSLIEAVFVLSPISVHAGYAADHLFSMGCYPTLPRA